MSSVCARAAVAFVLATLAALVPAPIPSAAQEGQPPEEDAGTRSTDHPGPNTVTAYGEAVDHGPQGPQRLAAPYTAMASTPSGAGYWVTAGDGGVFTFGDAKFAGSAGGIELAQPIVGMAPHQGGGYWLVASDGGVFTFGSARFHGSTGGTRLNRPIVGMAAHPGGDGYWLVASDGGVFSFGAAEFEGSMGGKDTDAPIVGLAASPDGAGYWMTTATGQVFGFGVVEQGSAVEAGDDQPSARTEGIAARPAGDGYWLVHGALPVLEVRDSGPAVEALQRRLDSLGYWVGPVDGIYGTLTEQAVYAFEKYEGLHVDGVADSATRAALGRASRPVPRTTSGSVIEIDKARQLLFFVQRGRVAWTFNTSTGTEEPYTFEGKQYLADTPPGRWEMYREVDGVRESNLGRLIRPKYFHTDGIAIHGYSFVPPYPASHGCVRVTLPAIDFIWANELAPMGADVWVYGETPR